MIFFHFFQIHTQKICVGLFVQGDIERPYTQISRWFKSNLIPSGVCSSAVEQLYAKQPKKKMAFHLSPCTL